MNKQEFQQKIKDMKPPKFFNAIALREAYEAGFEEAKESALLHSNSLDEPEKPVVPQFVADWYENSKDDLEYNLYKFCTHFREHKLRIDLQVWFGDNDKKPIETLVMMHKFGYEVEKEKEKEKLYTVELPNPNAGGHVVLCKTSDGIVSIYFTGMARWQGCKNFQLTEAEIKKDHDWAFRWAKEVEEC